MEQLQRMVSKIVKDLETKFYAEQLKELDTFSLQIYDLGERCNSLNIKGLL